MANRIEEPTYRVVAAPPGFEVRVYDATIVAETIVDGELGRAGNEGFRRLAGYIFGGNHGARRIEMTAPVAQAPVRIAMTAPVAQQPLGGDDLVAAGRYRITFTMPRGLAFDALPTPDDPRVRLREEPGRRLAALRFSGRWTDSLAAAKTAALREALARAGETAMGAPVYARYDPPWTLPWRRRNEILIPLAAAGQ